MNDEFKCQRIDSCQRCGRCCRFGGTITINADLDLKFRRNIYNTLGVLYPFPLNRKTIPILPSEKERLTILAKEMKKYIRFLPNRVVFDPKIQKFRVEDYFIDSAICPFLTKENSCGIYEQRPMICRDFPMVENQFKHYSTMLKKIDKIISKRYDFVYALEFVQGFLCKNNTKTSKD